MVCDSPNTTHASDTLVLGSLGRRPWEVGVAQKVKLSHSLDSHTHTRVYRHAVFIMIFIMSEAYHIIYNFQSGLMGISMYFEPTACSAALPGSQRQITMYH